MAKKPDPETIENLRTLCPKGTTVRVLLHKVSASGMSRQLRLLVMKGVENGEVEIHDITGRAAAVLGYRFNRDAGTMTIGGCGMDMGFAAVYDLARTLYEDGYALKREWL